MKKYGNGNIEERNKETKIEGIKRKKRNNNNKEVKKERNMLIKK